MDENPFGTVTIDAETLQEHINAVCESLTRISEAMNQASRGLADAFAELNKIIEEAEANGR